jgi:hypothetical protein
MLEYKIANIKKGGKRGTAKEMGYHHSAEERRFMLKVPWYL